MLNKRNLCTQIHLQFAKLFKQSNSVLTEKGKPKFFKRKINKPQHFALLKVKNVAHKQAKGWIQELEETINGMQREIEWHNIMKMLKKIELD